MALAPFRIFVLSALSAIEALQSPWCSNKLVLLPGLTIIHLSIGDPSSSGCVFEIAYVRFSSVCLTFLAFQL